MMRKYTMNAETRPSPDLNNSIAPKFKDQYIKLYPPGDNSPAARFYSLLKVHKANILFRLIVSACGKSN